MASTANPISDLWTDLPQELRDKIISHIPPPYLFSLRSVSRHWDSLISCPRFLRFCAQNLPPSNWLLVPRWPSYSGLLAFIPDQNSWKTIPFGLPLSLHVESSTRSSLLLRTPDYSFPQRLHVYVPLLRVSKQIIKCPSLVRGTAVLLEEPQSEAFKIFAISGSASEPSKELAFSDCASELHTVWYDSSRGTWEKRGRFPRDVIMGIAQKRSSVVVESEQGKLMLVFAERDRRQELFVYEFEKGKWGGIGLPDGDLELRNWIVRCEEQRGWVYLVQLNPGKRKVWIWRLGVEELVELIRRKEKKEKKEEKVKWKCEVGEYGVEGGVDDCVGFGGRIVLCNIPRFVCFNVGSRVWDDNSIPPPVEVERTDCVSRAFVFSPTLV